MTPAEWRALADEYYAIARKRDQDGDADAAHYWRRAADACREEAKRLEAQKEKQK